MTVAPRNLDDYTVRRGRLLAWILLLFITTEVFLSTLIIVGTYNLYVLKSTISGVVFFGIIYLLNRRGLVRLAIWLFCGGTAFLCIANALVVKSPIPNLFFLAIIVSIAAAFGSLHTEFWWASILTAATGLLNLLLYGTPIPPNAPLELSNGGTLPSILAMEVYAVAMVWGVAGIAYGKNRLFRQLLAESHAATAQATAAMEALRQSEARFATAFQASPLPLVISRLQDGQIITLNDAYTKLVGYRREELIGRTALELGIWANPTQPHENLEQLHTYGSVRDKEITIRTRTGVRRQVLVSLERIELDGEMCALAQFYDITERKQAEEALRVSEERYRIVSEVVSDFAFAYRVEADGAMTIEWVTDALTRITGCTLDEVRTAAQWQAIVHPEDCEVLHNQWRHVLAGQTDISEYRICAKDGQIHWLRLYSRPVRDVEQDRVAWIYGAAQDITTLKHLEQQLNHAQKMETVGRLAGGVAHDFNNLLMIISGHAELLRNNLTLDQQSANDLRIIREAADRAANLTRQLLAFARKQVLKPRVVNLNDILFEHDHLLRRLIGESIGLEMATTPNLWLVNVDTGQIEQLLINLVLNARDAMPGGGILTIETRNVWWDGIHTHHEMEMKPGPYVTLVVRDTGIGMTAEVQARLFEPFFTTKEVGKGTGLGMAACYGIAKQHGGDIWVDSTVGGGTTITVYLPKAEASPTISLPAEECFGPARGTETVLVVEDEPALRAMVTRVLHEQGYTVLEGASGEEALRLAHTYSGMIDLLITDMVMPHLGGQALARQLVALRPALKVLFMSGYPNIATNEHHYRSWGAAFMSKPFTPVMLTQ